MSKGRVGVPSRGVSGLLGLTVSTAPRRHEGSKGLGMKCSPTAEL